MSPIDRISDAAERLWRRGDVLRAALGEGPAFPYRIPLAAPRGAALLADFPDTREAIERLQAASASGNFALEYRDVWGQLRRADDDTLRDVLRAMHVDAGSEADVAQALRDNLRKRKAQARDAKVETSSKD